MHCKSAINSALEDFGMITNKYLILLRVLEVFFELTFKDNFTGDTKFNKDIMYKSAILGGAATISNATPQTKKAFGLGLSAGNILRDQKNVSGKSRYIQKPATSTTYE